MKGEQLVFGITGGLLFLFALGLLFFPSLVSVGPVDAVISQIDSVGAERVLLLTGACVVASLLFALRVPTHSETGETDAKQRFDQVLEQPPKGVTVGQSRMTGGSLDEAITGAITGGGEPLAAVRSQLQTTAAAVYADIMGVDYDAAREAVERGRWCDDRVVAAFLATKGVSQPLTRQLWLILSPTRERRRRIERTITAIEQLEHT